MRDEIEDMLKTMSNNDEQKSEPTEIREQKDAMEQPEGLELNEDLNEQFQGNVLNKDTSKEDL